MTLARSQSDHSDELTDVVAHIKSELKTEMSAGPYRTTIQPLQPLELDELVLDLTVPSDLQRKRLNQSDIQRMEDLATDYLHRTVQVRVSVSQQRLDTGTSTGTVGALNDNRSDPVIELRERVQRATAPPTGSTSKSAPTFDNFVTGGSNKFAHAAAVAASEAPGQKFTPLFIYGDSGLGKTHLLRGFGHNVNLLFPDKTCLFTTTEDYLNQFVAAIKSDTVQALAAKMRNVDVLLIDDIQLIAGKSGLQEELFHTLNKLSDMGSQVVMSCDSKPDGIQDLEERLRTRFSQGLVVDVQPPDTETRMAILNSMAEQIGFWLPTDVCTVIADRVSDNVRSLEGALRQVYARSNLFNDPITVELAESVLGDRAPATEERVSVQMIIEETASVSGYTTAQLVSASRKRALVQYRQIAMHLAREMTDQSLAELGAIFDRDHTTVMHAAARCEERLAERADFYDRYISVQKALTERLRGSN